MILNETSRDSDVTPSIYGSETEFGYHLLDERYEGLGDLIEHSGFNVDEIFWEPEHRTALEPNRASHTVFGLSPNAGRIYRDWNDQFEITTPECQGIFELVRYELAAEQLAIQALRRYQAEGLLDGFQLNKRTVDRLGNFWGAHENCSNRNINFLNFGKEQEVLNNLRAVHQISRTIYTGEGGLVHEGKNFVYVISPRMYKSGDLASTGRTAHPIVCTSYNDLNNNNEIRLQNCAGANVSPWAIAVKHGMNSVLMKLAENPKTRQQAALSIDRLEWRQSRSVTGMSCYDRSANFEIRLGKKDVRVRPSEIQTRLAELALEHLDLSDDEKWTCQEVIEVCDDLDRSPELAGDRIDWIARQQYLGSYGLQPSEAITDKHKAEKILNLDFCWDLIWGTSISQGVKKTCGPGPVRRSQGWGWHDMEQLTASEIDQACTTPPETRAKERMALARGGYDIENWQSGALYNPAGGNLKDPAEQHSRELVPVK